MVNDVKLDHIDNMNNILTSKKPLPGDRQRANLNTSGVQVQLSSLEGLMVSESSTDEATRVLEMKHRIDSNNYKVDTDVLATKLYNNVFKNIKTIG
jgi:anti-sigma28 factor (negative regulator of flagellin synthesis)